MKILEVTYQNRRDFTALMECEGCAATSVNKSGYDDHYYHDQVIPAMKCKACGKSRNDFGISAAPTATKYQPHEVI